MLLYTTLSTRSKSERAHILGISTMNFQVDFNGVLNEFTEIMRLKIQPGSANECLVNNYIITTDQSIAERPRSLSGEKGNRLCSKTRNHSFIKQSLNQSNSFS